MSVYYPITVEQDETDDGDIVWMVTSPSFPEITTFSDIQQETGSIGLKAIEEAIAARIADGEQIPIPLANPHGSQSVELSALTYLKLSLYTVCREKQVTRAELARRLGWHREQVDRLFRMDHKSQLDQLEAAFKALGEGIRFSMPPLLDAA